MIHTISAGYRGHRNAQACPGDGGVVQCQMLWRKIEDKYIYLFALVNMLQLVIRSHQQLSLSRVLCPESVVSFSKYVISVDVTMQVRTVNMFQHLACYGS